MYLLLLMFGAAFGAVGIVIGTSGVSIHDRAFDMSLLTPGIVAAMGGLILIGLGLALRALQRIEFALAARPMPRAIRPGDAAVTAAASEVPLEPQNVPFPAKRDIRPHAVAAPAQPAEAKAIDPARLRFAAIAALENAGPLQENGGAPSATGESHIDQAVGEPHEERPAAKVRNGGSAKIAPRLDTTVRPSPPSERAKGPAFDTFWPKAPRPVRAPQPAHPPAIPAAVEAEPGGASGYEPAATAAQEDGPAPLSVLKSGVVDGMAYTLFSDGSIEAQLPQGTLRFGSIAELRHHIEQTPPDAAAS